MTKQAASFATNGDESRTAGPWSAALATIREWDPAGAETFEKMATNPWTSGVLPRKTVELLSVALSAACTTLDAEATRRHIRAALDAGASRDELLAILQMCGHSRAPFVQPGRADSARGGEGGRRGAATQAGDPDAGLRQGAGRGSIHQLAIIERLIRSGIYKGPVNGFFSMVGGGVCGTNPCDWMELIRRTPQGSVWTYQTMFRYSWPLASFCITLGQHTRTGLEENFWDVKKGGPRMTTVQMVEKHVRMARELGREIATADEARRILKVGVLNDTVEETLFNLGLPPNRPEGQPGFLVYDTDGRTPRAAVPGVDPSTLIL